MSGTRSTIEQFVDDAIGTDEDVTASTSPSPDAQPQTDLPDDDNTPLPGDARETPQPAPTPASPNPADPKQPATQPGTQPANPQPGTDPNAQQPAQRTNTQTVPRGRYPADEAGNLIDPRSGAIIAAAGRERQYYEAARNSNYRYEKAQQDLQTVQTQLAAYKEAATLPTQLNLQPAEVTTAMQFMSHWKKNPVEAATKMLTDLRAMGYEVEGIGSTVDTAAMQKMMDDRLKPFISDREQQTRQAEAARAVETEINAVVEQFDWAEQQFDELNSLMQTGNYRSLREAAYALEAWALRNQLDLSRSLRDQYLSAPRQAAAPVQPQQQPRPNAARGIVPNTNTAMAAPTQHRAHNPSASYSDIVRDAMREAGANVENI